MNKSVELAKRLLVDSIWKSANLEGLGTSFPRTVAILNNRKVETSKEEVMFIINMKNAWEFMLKNLDYNNCFMLMSELNKQVAPNLFYGAGEVRNTDVSIGGTAWKPEMPVASFIYDDIHVLNAIKDAELRALKYFCYITRTQIFIDGSKRIAQLMANKILIENNIGVFQIPIEYMNKFKDTLLRFYESNNDEEIINFMKRKCIVRVVEEEYDEVEDIDDSELEDVEIKHPMEFSSEQLCKFSEMLFKLTRMLRKSGIVSCNIEVDGYATYLKMESEDNIVITKEYEDLVRDLQHEVNTVLQNVANYVLVPVQSVNFKTGSDLFRVGRFVKNEENNSKGIYLA